MTDPTGMSWARTPDGYLQYLASPHWHQRRRRAFALADGECMGCGGRAEHIHHRTYDRLGDEWDEDLADALGQFDVADWGNFLIVTRKAE